VAAWTIEVHQRAWFPDAWLIAQSGGVCRIRVAPVRPSKTVACDGPEAATASGPGAAETNGPVTRATSVKRNWASATAGHARQATITTTTNGARLAMQRST
jgi:hypothetical protein